MDHSRERCHFIPPWLIERIDAAQVDLDEAFRERRASTEAFARTPTAGAAREAGAAGAGAAGAAPVPWTVHDAVGTTTLPGRPVRSVGDPASGDVAVDEAAAGISATLAMFADGLGRSSYDGAGSAVSLTVHYGRDYDNAFWDGRQLVFGDGDGRVFERFTKPVDVLAHEFGHGVVEHTAGLVYRGQPGALNESVADVFASCLKQHVLGQDAVEADWLIGEGLFLPSVRARGLRDMAHPGTAFDDPVLGTDPQVGHMDDFVITASDNGGVHLNSGIPNRAFHLAAVAIGGSSLEGAGQVWYDALTRGDIGPTASFGVFAAATLAVAGEHADAVRSAWAQVGVEVATARPGVVRVSRSGGFTGWTTTAAVALSDCGDDLLALVDRIWPGLSETADGAVPQPDRFVYTFEVGDRPPVSVPEQELTDDLRELAHQVLGRGTG